MSAQVRLDVAVVAAGRFLTSSETGFWSPYTELPCVLSS